MAVFQEKAMVFAGKIHLRIFGYEMGEEMRKFLGHLSWSFFGGGIAAGILLGLNILAGRWLGPEEYGKYGLVIAIGSILVIPMTLGIDTALTFYVSRDVSDSEKNENIHSSLWVIGLFIIAEASAVFLFSEQISSLLDIVESVLIVGAIFSIFLAIRNMFDAVTRGFHFFKYQSIIRTIEALVIFSVFISLAWKQELLTFKSYIIAMSAGYIFSNIAIAFKIRGSIGISTTHTKKIMSYGSFAILGSLFGVMTNSLDKIFINTYMGPEQLGIYTAYSTASLLLVGQMMTLFINVFFPTLSSINDSGLILKKINKLAGIFFVPTMLGLTIATWLIVSLFGEKYSLDWLLVIEFSFLGALTMYFTALWWLIASKGRTGIRFTSFNGIISGVIFCLLMFIFSSNLSLYHVVLFLIISIFYNIVRGNLCYARIK